LTGSPAGFFPPELVVAEEWVAKLELAGANAGSGLFTFAAATGSGKGFTAFSFLQPARASRMISTSGKRNRGVGKKLLKELITGRLTKIWSALLHER